MSDNPLIEGFLKIHEAGGVGGGMSGTKFSKVANYAPAVGAGVRGAVDNATLGTGKYVRAAADYAVKNLGSVAGINEPTTFNKELEQEREKDTAAQQNHPAAWDVGDKAATAAGVATGIGGVAKTIAGAVAKKAAREVAKSAAKTSKDFELGVGRLDLFPDEAVSSMRPPAQPSSTLNLTPQMRVPTKPPASLPPLNLTPQMRVPSTPASQAAPVSQTPLNLTPQMRVQGSRKVIPFPKNNRLTTEEQNEPSKGNTEMSTNPFIKGFFDIEEARAKNTNIFDESKKLTAAQKKNLDKNDNDKIDAEDFKMLRKEEAIEEAKKPKPGHNAMVMARNVSKVLKAAKPDFLDIDKDGDKEEPMKKAAADMKKEEVEFSEEEVEALDEKAKWRSSSAAKKITDPDKDLSLADYDYHYENPRSTGRLKSIADTETEPYSIINRRKSKITSMGPRKGMVSKADINRVKSNAFNTLNKEEVEFSEEEMNFINSVMEAMPVAPTSEADSPNPTPKKKAEGSRAKGSMAD